MTASRGVSHGELRGGKVAELRLGTGILGNTGLVFYFPIVVAPIYGGFVYLALPRWVLAGNVYPPRNAPRNHTGRFGPQK